MRFRRSIGAGLALAGLALLGRAAGVAAPGAEAVPLPPERPAELLPATPPGTPIEAAPSPPTRPPELAPGPGPAPAAADAGPAIPEPPPAPPERPAEFTGEAAASLAVAPPDDTACRVRLKRLGVAFEPLPPISEGQCGAPLPLRITALGDGIALPDGATLVCNAAEALARWATEVQTAAEREVKAPLKGIALAGSYECRGQNHNSDAKLSEHAFANAVDVTGFTFAGREPIAVAPAPEGSVEGRFLDAVRTRACGMFRTVLGPGANAEHANHFHLDERDRTAGHRLCE